MFMGAAPCDDEKGTSKYAPRLLILKYRGSDVFICRQVSRIQSQALLKWTRSLIQQGGNKNTIWKFSPNLFLILHVERFPGVEVLPKVLGSELEIQKLCQQ